MGAVILLTLLRSCVERCGPEVFRGKRQSSDAQTNRVENAVADRRKRRARRGFAGSNRRLFTAIKDDDLDD